MKYHHKEVFIIIINLPLKLKNIIIFYRKQIYKCQKNMLLLLMDRTFMYAKNVKLIL